MKITAVVLVILFFSAFNGNGLLAQDVHKISSGETLSQLARKYKTTVNELIRLNPDAAKGLKAGAELRLPGEKNEKSSSSVTASVKKHKVVSGESLSRIAKKYKVSVADLENWNQLKAAELKAGQEILVSAPAGSESIMTPKPAEAKNEKPAPAESHPHKVEKGETLSSIAQKAGTTIAEIKKLNQLKNNQVRLGQVLQLPGASAAVEENKMTEVKSETAKPESTPVQVKKEPVPKTEVSRSEAVPVETNSVPVNEIPVKTEEKPQAGIREINNTLGYTRIVETGFAEAIDGDVNSKKHLCLHKSAPAGSILQVKNEVNGQSVFVKVIGKLPETGSNEKIIIRISRQAYERLMAAGKRFPVEVSYPESQP